MLDSARMNRPFELVYGECAGRGLRYALALLRNHSDAEEAVQEAFCRMQQSGLVESNREYQGTFFRTLRNHCIDRLRKKSVRRETDSPELQGVGQQGDPVEFNELVCLLERAIVELPENWSRALLLKTRTGLSYAEIAQEMDATNDQIRTWIYRARRQLEDELILAGHIESDTRSD